MAIVRHTANRKKKYLPIPQGYIRENCPWLASKEKQSVMRGEIGYQPNLSMRGKFGLSSDTKNTSTWDNGLTVWVGVVGLQPRLK